MSQHTNSFNADDSCRWNHRRHELDQHSDGKNLKRVEDKAMDCDRGFHARTESVQCVGCWRTTNWYGGDRHPATRWRPPSHDATGVLLNSLAVVSCALIMYMYSYISWLKFRIYFMILLRQIWVKINRRRVL